METAKLKKFAQYARRSLIEQISSKLKLVLDENSAARRDSTEAIKKLEEAIKGHGKEQIIDRVAYIWFNRFCSLRFMDVNRYNRVNVVSPADPGQFQPEILAEAKMGHIDEEIVRDKVRHQIFALLEGKAPSRDPQGEAYRLLVVDACNYRNEAMPFLFQCIDDYTELLMPDDLLSGNSILAYTREAMTTDACKDVEVIGWLYQFYISEKKDEVFDGLKKNKKITPENIPAATQFFTPHWIVRYLVENSLGRLWMLNRPSSRLVDQMDYYIKPEQAETDFLRISKPEEIKICDPACGSGHMLTYAFDLLYAIYEEEGYETAEIPEKILINNLYGIEIDERAGELASFALTMKAVSKFNGIQQRRFFIKGVKPNVCVLANVELNFITIENYKNQFGEGIFSPEIVATIQQFEEANNFGSLITPIAKDIEPVLRDLSLLEERSNAKLGSKEQLSKEAEVLVKAGNFKKILQTLRQADYLSPKYHVVIANPPYMGAGSMNNRLKVFAQDNYKASKSDLFAMFIARNLDLAQKHGAVAMITMQSWMFLSSFEALRARVLGQNTLLSMAHLGARAFDGIGGEVVSTTAFVLKNSNRLDYKGGYLRLVAGNSEAEKSAAIREAVMNQDCGWFYRASANEFNKIPGQPIAYWFSENVADNCVRYPTLSTFSDAKSGMSSCNSDLFLRQWFEVSSVSINRVSRSHSDAQASGEKWFPYNKGGGNRRWFGYNDVVINWMNEGSDIKNFVVNNPKDPNTTHWSRRLFNLEYFFQTGLTWSAVTSGRFSCREVPVGIIPGTGSKTLYDLKGKVEKIVFSLLNTNVSSYYLSVFSPTLNFEAGDVVKLPVIASISPEVLQTTNLVQLSKCDWDSYESSWDFTGLPLLSTDYRQPTLKATYQKLRAHWREMALEMQRLEQENNRIFIDAYGLQDELTPEVSLNEITLTCNPHYRYGNDKSEEELEALLLADTMRELVSYAVGCMFGRYALDKPGLILANQGETLADYVKQIPHPSFSADEDNVIPMLDGDWFTDDIAERFRKFLRVAFGEDHYEANLRFVEQALNIKGKGNYSIRGYFLGEFYTDHVKRYKKRPIYWLFSSPKGSFNALIYMHRYRPDTVSVVLNDYLREFRTKLTSHKNHLEAVRISASSSQGEKTKALKEIEKITRMIAEMEAYEREVLYPLASEQVEIDLDDGVKVNYPKLGAALKKIVGLDAKED